MKLLESLARLCAILAGLLGTQVRMVLAAHRRAGLVLERRIDQGHWSALVLRKR
jgi:ribosomal protein L11 methyltransferase